MQTNLRDQSVSSVFEFHHNWKETNMSFGKKKSKKKFFDNKTELGMELFIWDMEIAYKSFRINYFV